MSPFARLRRLAVGLVLPLAGYAAESAVPPLQLETFALQPRLVEFAHGHRFALEGFDPATAGSARTGDAVTMLVTLRRTGKPARQWILEFTVATPTAEERVPDRNQSITINGPSGRRYRFAAGENVALAIRSAGPFGDGLKLPTVVNPARATISPDLLGIGLDETCRTMLRLNAKRSPPTEAGQPQSPPLLNEPEERVFVGFVPALMTLFQGIQNTPGLREILWEVAEKPSVWSIARHRGRVDLGLNFTQDAVAECSPESAVLLARGARYRLSPLLSLNETPALRCSLFVTSPRPPLLTTAGVVAIVAEAPAGKARRVDIQILSTRRGTGG